jgi:hypothetical protein
VINFATHGFAVDHIAFDKYFREGRFLVYQIGERTFAESLCSQAVASAWSKPLSHFAFMRRFPT